MNIYPGLIEELDMQRYVKLAGDVLSDSNVKMLLYNDSGEVCWASDSGGYQQNIVTDYTQQECAEFTGESYSCIDVSTAGDNKVRFHFGELADGSACNLLFYGFGKDNTDKGAVEYIVTSLGNIVELIKSNIGYLCEVNTMAMELGDRYDELGMLRMSEDAESGRDDSQHVLSRYIRNCAEHLQVEYAAIWVATRQELYPGGLAYIEGNQEIFTILESLSWSSFGMFKNGYAAFGINGRDDELRNLVDLSDDWKVLLVPVLDAGGRPVGVISCLNSIHNRDFTSSDKSTLEAVARKAYKYLLSTQDELTGLLNRKGLEETDWMALPQSGYIRYLVLFNINQFKVINAAYGTVAGDMVLKYVADVISNPVNGLMYPARLDADMFAAVIDDASGMVDDYVSNICNEIDSTGLIVSGKSLSIKSRAGLIAIDSADMGLADYLYADEFALSNAREDDKQVVAYKPDNTVLLQRYHQLAQVENIKTALQEGRFQLYCQRIQPLKDDELHYEILVRMIDNTGGLVPPADFIPVAEKYKLMNQVDRWIIKNTFRLLCQEQYREITSICKWGINLSGMTIGDPGFHEYVSQCLREYDFQPSNLYFEITETAAIKDYDSCVAFMEDIHAMGVQFALDDFGSGLSSFGYLKNFSIDYLKIDGSLVKDIVNSKLDVAMVTAIADIARVLDVRTIAEYVENDLILDVLKNLNIDYAQGYGIMKPLPLEQELQNLIADNKIKKYSFY